MDIETINEVEYLYNIEFKFKNLNKRKNLTLDRVLPINSALSYCVFLTPLYISKLSDKLIKSFEELFCLANLEKNSYSLTKIRKTWVLIEDTKLLDRTVKDEIKKISKKSKIVYIKCAEDCETTHYWKMDIDDFFMSNDLIDEMPVNFGHFSIFDELNTWYLLINDDDPFIFFAGPKCKVENICKNFPQFAICLDPLTPYCF